MNGQRRTSRVIYLHGFRSSPQSFKAKLLAERFAQLGLTDRFACPALPVAPMAAVQGVLAEYRPGPNDTLIGSSLGGYYATWLAEHTGCRAVLLNPAIEPAVGLAAYVGEQPFFHGEGSFRFEAAYLDELTALQAGPITRPARYFLIAATGDELLDWRTMSQRYAGARQWILPGSDHGLSNFADCLDEVLAFAGIVPSQGS